MTGGTLLGKGSGDSGFEFSVYISMDVFVWLEFGSQKDSTWLLMPCVLRGVACCGLFWAQLYYCGVLLTTIVT